MIAQPIHASCTGGSSAGATCLGDGTYTQKSNLCVSIQAGTADGDEIRIASEGCARNSRHAMQHLVRVPSLRGTHRHREVGRPHGDVVLHVKQQKHASFLRKVGAHCGRHHAERRASHGVLCPLQGDDLLTEQTISLREALCSEAFALAHLDGRKVRHRLPLPCSCHCVHELLRVSELEHMRLCLAFKGLCAARSKRSGPLGPAAPNPEYD